MKNIFVVPGFKEKKTDKAYIDLKKTLEKNGFSVSVVPITWNYKVLSEQIVEFEDFYQKNKGDKNYILGFSFGAMIASVVAGRVNPDKLFLCSLSPYFKEDIDVIPNNWKNFIGKRRVNDFSKMSFSQIASLIKAPTIVFLGEKEAIKFPLGKNRCKKASAKIKNCTLLSVVDAPHNIGDKNYLAAIKKHVR